MTVTGTDYECLVCCAVVAEVEGRLVCHCRQSTWLRRADPKDIPQPQPSEHERRGS
jgi:hypothetical protein